MQNEGYRMKILRELLTLSLGIFTVAVAPSAFAAQCNTNSPRNTPIFKAFNAQYNQDYDRSRLNTQRAHSLAVGHAIGRLGIAVYGRSEREVGYACIILGLEQAIAANELQGIPTMDYQLAQEASWGMHDDEVGRLTGVYNRVPYDNVMDKVYGQSSRQSSSLSQSQSPGQPSRQASNQSMRQSIFGIGPSNTPSAQGSTAINMSPVRGRPYANKECTSYANFSLSNADTFLSLAETLKNDFYASGYTECYDDGWFICRDILANLTLAKRQVNQVFVDAISGNCRKCNLDAVQRYGRHLLSEEKWLVGRGYNSAWGSAQNFSRSIDDHMDDKKCDVGQQQIPTARGGDQNNAVIASGSSGNVQGWGVDHGGVTAGVGEVKSSPATDGFTSFFQAPSSMLGNWSRYSTFSFSLKSWGGEYYSIEGNDDIPQKGDISISNGNKVMAITIGDNHGQGFKQYDISLRGGNWRFYGGANSASDILGNVTSVSIRSEYGAGDDWSILRDVKTY